MDNNSAETVDLLERARSGDPEAKSAIFARHPLGVSKREKP